LSVEQWLIHSLIGVPRGSAVDVGANVGSWTRYLAAEFSLVTAVEPDARAYERLRAALPKNALALRRAVCGTNGDVTLYMRPSAEQSSLLEAHPIGAGGCAPAPVAERAVVNGTTLDALCPRGADFLKMDIEGAEVEALRGASPEPWKRCTFLIECHDTFAEVATELDRLGKLVERIPHPLHGAHPGHCWAIGRPW
jgi:FkbM family methyltransferase